MKTLLLIMLAVTSLLSSCKYYSNYEEFLDAKRPYAPKMIYTDFSKEFDSLEAKFNESNQSNFVPPEIVKQGKLKYPPDLLWAGIQGEVRFLVLIKKDGSVEERGLLCYNHEGFVEPARKAILSSKYERIEEEMTFFLPVRFSLLHTRSATCEIHGDVNGFFSVESGFYICPLCYPESAPSTQKQ